MLRHSTIVYLAGIHWHVIINTIRKTARNFVIDLRVIQLAQLSTQFQPTCFCAFDAIAQIITHILVAISEPDTAGVTLSILITVLSSSPLPTMTTDTKRGTLTIAGSGIASIVHSTLETLLYQRE
ncbi:hypothetical protein K503DRAFT_605901 [Rhizopogon vinicolor AM-OR11-026]|uniref:Uncharacterized protein n=1 Tax=Rhizopogon vinicolor AM-OR11-026 TaxID=1314800 RepID=A0A1B7MIN5_9AGAM|nr:hypothetical protein K503DRAFT_605901 [Rhizopogon vinicolor AM-OR11-026]